MLKVLFPAELTDFPSLVHVKSRKKKGGKVNLLFFKDNNKS